MNGRELAQALGVSEATVSRLASGHRKPGLTQMIKIRSVLGWKLDAQADALQSGTYGQVFAEKMAKKKGPRQPASGGRGQSAGPAIVDEVQEWQQPNAS